MFADPPAVAPQFNDASQQRDAATLGMWLFLATEVLFFGGLFLGYTVYRVTYPVAFREASNHTLVAVGSINTAILLISSFLMVLAVRATQQDRRKAATIFLMGTAMLGAAFLTIKGFEYHHEIEEGLLPGAGFQITGSDPQHAQMFFYLYFLMTGVHAVHVGIGVFLLGLFALRVKFAARADSLTTAVDLLGLYWHFVDVVWVFLFPLIYLIGRST